MEHLFENLKKLRFQNGLSQRDVAYKLAITPGYISQIESKRNNPSLDILERLATLYELKIGQLFDENLFENLQIIKREINVPDYLVSSIRRFLLNFPEFVKYVKGVDVFFEVTQEANMIIIQILESDQLDINQISKYFSEFIGLATEKIKADEIIFENIKLNEAKKDSIRKEYSNEIKDLKRKIYFLNNQNNIVLEERNFLRQLSINLSKNKSIMKIENQNIYGGNQQFADFILNASRILDETDSKFLQLINENTTSYEEKQELIKCLENVKSQEETTEQKKKSGGILKKFIESIVTEGGKQVVKELIENGAEYWQYIF